MDGITEILKGILEGIILEYISREETYGYAITHHLQEVGFTDIVEGTVYTVLVRLEKKALVTVTKKKSTQGPMRKFYQLNEQGVLELEKFWQRWDFVAQQMQTLKGERSNGYEMD